MSDRLGEWVAAAFNYFLSTTSSKSISFWPQQAKCSATTPKVELQCYFDNRMGQFLHRLFTASVFLKGSYTILSIHPFPGHPPRYSYVMFGHHSRAPCVLWIAGAMNKTPDTLQPFRWANQYVFRAVLSPCMHALTQPLTLTLIGL